MRGPNGIIQAYDEEAFHTGVFSGTAPLTSYDLATYAQGQPAARVRYGATSATITITLGSPFQGDVFALPISNASAIQLTNGSGLNVAIPVPAMTRSRVTKTAVADLTLLQPNPTTRTATVWNVILTGAANLTVGGAVLLYGPIHRLLEPFLAPSSAGSRKVPINRQKTSFVTETQNEYGTRYLQAHGTYAQVITLNHYERTDASVADFEDWFQGSMGGGLPSLLWNDPSVNDAYYGTWNPLFEVRVLELLHEVTVEFHEFSKGRAV